MNGTAGILLENDGTLAINQVVDRMLREAPALEFSSYAPLKGLPDFLDLSISLALGDHRGSVGIDGLWFRFNSITWRLWGFIPRCQQPL